MSIDSTILNLYFDSELLQNEYALITEKLRLLSPEQAIFTDKIHEINNEIFNFISKIKIDNIYISITSSNSIFYRFLNLDNKIEFKLEAFFDVQDDEKEFEAVLHVYKDGKKNTSYFGPLGEVNEIVKGLSIKSEFGCYEYKPINLFTEKIYQSSPIPIPAIA
jgi:hypothetical protein